jgi:hypothetical protein
LSEEALAEAEQLINNYDYYEQVFLLFGPLAATSLGFAYYDMYTLRNGWENDSQAHDYHFFQTGYALLIYWQVAFLVWGMFYFFPFMGVIFRPLINYSWFVGTVIIVLFVEMRHAGGLYSLRNQWSNMFMHFVYSWAAMINTRNGLLNYIDAKTLLDKYPDL